MALAISGGSSIGSSTGVQATSATKGGSGSVLGAISQFSSVTSLLSGLISGKTIAKTIGQALSDGFSCWGATWTPSRAENELPYWLNLIHQEFTKSLDVKREDLEASLNNFYQEFWGNVASDYDSRKTLENWIGWRYDSAKDCTLKGLKVLEKGVVDYINNPLIQFLKDIEKDINVKFTFTERQITLYRTEAGGKTVKVPYQMTVPKIAVEVKSNVVEDVKSLASNRTVWTLVGSGIAAAALGVLFVGSPDKKKKKKRKTNKLFK